MEEKYLYEVRPIRAKMFGSTMIVRGCSIQLTKDEVLDFMKSGPVFRKFAGKKEVRVSGDNLDQLHQAEYINPTDTVSIPTEEPKSTNEEIADVKEITPAEDKVESLVETKNSIEEVSIEASNSQEEESIEEEEVIKDTSSEDDKKEEPPVLVIKNKSQHYNGNNNKHKH